MTLGEGRVHPVQAANSCAPSPDIRYIRYAFLFLVLLCFILFYWIIFTVAKLTLGGSKNFNQSSTVLILAAM